MQQHQFEDFNSEGHYCFLDKVYIRFIDKRVPSEPLKRKSYWKSIFKTMALWGINAEDSA